MHRPHLVEDSLPLAAGSDARVLLCSNCRRISERGTISAGDLLRQRGGGETSGARMRETLFYIFSSLWIGAVHAATPGHGKTIAAAYIVGARGRPVDAVILGVFVTLSHTTGIVLVGLL